MIPISGRLRKLWWPWRLENISAPSFWELIVVFLQDYVENMERHKDNKMWKQWNLETTAKILEKRFPNSFVWVVRPSRYHLNTFSCYHNFVEANLFGAPDHRNSDYGALRHLQALLGSAVRQSKFLAFGKVMLCFTEVLAQEKRNGNAVRLLALALV